MAEEVRNAQPKEYYRKFLEEGVRPDNREIGSFRPTVLDIGSKNGSCISTAEGSSLVRLGNTIVMCGVKGELAEPKTDTPSEGFIVPNVELSPLCSPRFRPGPPGEQAQVLSQAVDNVLKNSQCVCLEDLCIVPGKKVWVLYVDLVCLNYDGNVLDACVLAMTAALSNTALPAVSVEEETGKVEVDFQQENKVPLKCSPISTTLAVFDESVMLVDPTGQEEDLVTGVITVVTDGHDICSIHKPGGTPLTEAQLKQCTERALQRHREACDLITAALPSPCTHPLLAVDR
ncbi:exosome complex component RRP43-like [Babylonia areolata]|uniref:exosome complex component RRP43-like n=1 Tax=Babylonia areolata TaxID=304850 RepID=UPI003FD26D82